jgi:hypothetical protein
MFFCDIERFCWSEIQIPSSVNGAQLFAWSKPHMWQNSVLKTWDHDEPVLLIFCHMVESCGLGGTLEWPFRSLGASEKHWCPKLTPDYLRLSCVCSRHSSPQCSVICTRGYRQWMGHWYHHSYFISTSLSWLAPVLLALWIFLFILTVEANHSLVNCNCYQACPVFSVSHIGGWYAWPWNCFPLSKLNKRLS